MENNSTLKAITGLITLIVLCFTMCTTCGDDRDDFYGTYTFYDALNHKTIITVSEGGDAVFTIDASSLGNSELVRLAWGKATEGINCVWDTVYRCKGGDTLEGIEIKGNGVEVYLGDGYAYFSYFDFDNFRNGVPYEFEEE